MSTFRDLITDAHKILGIVGIGGSVRPSQAADALALAKRMLDAWNAERLCIGTVARTTYTWTASQSSRTIAASGAQLTGPRPLWIDSAAVIPVGATLETDLGRPMTRDEYAVLPDKARTATVFDRLAYEPTFPNGTLIVYPVPTTAPTLVLYVPVALTSEVTLATVLSYAPGYEEAAQYQLAKRLSTLYPGTWTEVLNQLAQDAMQRVQRSNIRTAYRKNDPALCPGGGFFDIDNGRFRR